MARFQCHLQKFMNELAKWRVGSFFLLVQSLMAIAPGHGRKLLSDNGRGFLRAWRTSTKPWGDKWAFSVKWINFGSMMRVNPRLLCFTIVAACTSWLLVTDSWLPYFKKAWKFSSVADALHSAGAPIKRIRLMSACISASTISLS